MAYCTILQVTFRPQNQVDFLYERTPSARSYFQMYRWNNRLDCIKDKKKIV